MPAGVLETFQAQQGEDDERATVGIGCRADRPLQQAKRSIVIACFEREQAPVDRRQCRGVVGQATPGAIEVAQRDVERSGASGPEPGGGCAMLLAATRRRLSVSI